MFGKKNVFKIIKKGSASELKSFLEQHPEQLEARGSNNRTPLLEATYRNKPEHIHVLIELNANLDAQAASHNTSLCIGASNGFDECVRILLDAGADETIPGWHGLLPIHRTNKQSLKALFSELAPTAKPNKALCNQFSKESTDIVSYTEFAEESNATITTFYNFADQSITRKIKDVDGVCACMQGFNQAAGNDRLNAAAQYLKENEGNLHGYKIKEPIV